jgi:class 3 adenylate cyclase
MSATELSCGSCGTALNERAKFCNACGAAVSYITPPAEYKQVTVLFADVVHSMDIAAAVGGGAAPRDHDRTCHPCGGGGGALWRRGGQVHRRRHHGGVRRPVALEDHALRACLTALGIQEDVSRLGAEVRRRDGIDQQLRVGLNSGQVNAGEIGSAALGYTAIGEQVGMAQRMESVGAPGAVMLSDSTARLVEGAVALG